MKAFTFFGNSTTVGSSGDAHRRRLHRALSLLLPHDVQPVVEKLPHHVVLVEDTGSGGLGGVGRKGELNTLGAQSLEDIKIHFV